MPPKTSKRTATPKKTLFASGLVLILAACAQSPTTLPDTATMPTRASAETDRARHAKSMSETQSAATTRKDKAIKEIEAAR